jgi:hypothetical protein
MLAVSNKPLQQGKVGTLFLGSVGNKGEKFIGKAIAPVLVPIEIPEE